MCKQIMVKNSSVFNLEWRFGEANLERKEIFHAKPNDAGFIILLDRAPFDRYISVAWPLTKKWETIDLLDIINRAEKEKDQHPGKMPYLSIGTKLLGTKWDPQLLWAPEKDFETSLFKFFGTQN